MAGQTLKLDGRGILLGVSGGVAAYKAVDLASRLTKAGADVRCILTEHALEFIRPLSFEAVTGMPAFTSLWKASDEYRIGHVSLADVCDICVVAPATANILAKAAAGICDDLLSTTLCTCWERPMLIAPAMNDRMWRHPAVRQNVETLKSRGVTFIGPEAGRLACGAEGWGRMSEPQDIAAAVEALAANL